ncbi:MAG: prolyl oligopeptidase family serine peptidase [Pseudomonadota bacterium]
MKRRLAPLLALLLLSACGGGGSGAGSVTPPPPPPARGSLAGGGAQLAPVVVGGVPLARLEPAVLAALLEAAQSGTVALTGTPKCAITPYSVRYHTLGGAGESTEASGAVIIPSGADPACSGARPVLLYAHGTAIDQRYDMSKLADSTEAKLVAAMFAAQGFIVVAPNYAGYAGSTLAYHPYLDANQQSADMVDALRAARLSFGAMAAADSGKLYVSGYSQGGHVALATMRAMQLQYGSEFKVSAAAGMSGPYALVDFADGMFAGAPRIGVTAFMPLLINAGQHAGAGLYGSLSEIYEAQYASGIDSLLPSASSLDALIVAGKLPATTLFAANSLPQASGYAKYFGSGNLIKTSYRDAYQLDAKAHPCGGNAPLACAPEHALRKLLRQNDVRNFTPASALMLCGGNGDPTVPYQNTVSALAYYRALTAAGAVLEVDLDTVPGLSDPYRNQKAGFLAAKLALRLDALQHGDSGDAAVESNYHAGLVAPFCFQAVRAFFQASSAP